MPLIVGIYYAGELVWRDRELRLHEMLHASPAPDWAFALPKILAIALVLMATVAARLSAPWPSRRCGIRQLRVRQVLTWYVLPWAVDVTLIAILGIFIQVLVPHKFVGWLRCCW